MAFSDLVLQCQPAYAGAGSTGSGTEDATWRWRIADTDTGLGFTTTAGVPIDLSGATGVCKIWESVGGAVVLTLTISGDSSGVVTISASSATTAGKAIGQQRRECVWGATLTIGSETAQLWSPSNSPFTILAAD